MKLVAFARGHGLTADEFLLRGNPLRSVPIRNLVNEIYNRVGAAAFNAAGQRLDGPEDGQLIDPDDIRAAGGIEAFVRRLLTFADDDGGEKEDGATKG